MLNPVPGVRKPGSELKVGELGLLVLRLRVAAERAVVVRRRRVIKRAGFMFESFAEFGD